jgi:acetyl-CoA carboxylase carboxyltransferase component
VDEETLAGARTENYISGNAHQLAENDEDAIRHVKKYLSYMPSNCTEKVPIVPHDDDCDRLVYALDDIIPDSEQRPYDCHRVMEYIADKDSLSEYQPFWAQNIVCCFARIMGETVGLIANQTNVNAGCFDIDASDKFARFVDILDCYNITIITLTDTPGFRPGKNQEHGGIIRHGAKTLEAVYRATVPKIQVVLRKQFGGAALPMGFNLFALDVNLYWPTFNYGIMDSKVACKIILSSKIKAHPEQEEELLAEAVAEFEDARTPYAMCEKMFADDIIEPNETRKVLIKVLEMLRNKNPELIPVPNRKTKHPVSPR